MQLKSKTTKTFNGEKIKVGIAVARFNEEITQELLASALDFLKKCKVKGENIKVVSVAGCVEIPFALQQLARSKKYNCLVAIGCIIKGETPHFDYVAKTVQEGALRVSLDYNIPIGFGVLTTNNVKQAKERYHVGAQAASAAIELSLQNYK